MWGVKLIVGATALILAGLIAFPWQMRWPRACVALTVTGAAGLLSGSWGPWAHRMVTEGSAKAGPYIGRWTGLGVSVIAAMLVVGVWAAWVLNSKVDLRTLGLSAAMPLAVTLIPGTAGIILTFIVGLIPMVVSFVISGLFFGGWGG